MPAGIPDKRPPFNDGEWKNEPIEPPESAHPLLPTPKPTEQVELPPFDVKEELMKTLRDAGANVITDIEHEKERQHLRNVAPGKPAIELRDSMSRHPAGKKRPDDPVERELADLVNRHGLDSALGIPDYILARTMLNFVRDLAQGIDMVRRHENG